MLETEEKNKLVKRLPFRIRPTLLRKAHAFRLFLVGIAICAVTLFMFKRE